MTEDITKQRRRRVTGCCVRYGETVPLRGHGAVIRGRR